MKKLIINFAVIITCATNMPKKHIIFSKEYIEEHMSPFLNDEESKLITIFSFIKSGYRISIKKLIWQENSECIEFSQIMFEKGKYIFKINNRDGWVSLKKFSNLRKNLFCLCINIGEKRNPVLIFTGCQDGNSPGLLTIISLEEDKPIIIYNKQANLKRIVKNGKNYKLRVQYDYDEHLVDKDENLYAVEPNPYCDEIYIENNELKVVQTYRVPEDDPGNTALKWENGKLKNARKD